MKLPFMDTLGSVGMVGERKATALLCLGFYTTLFFMIGLSARSELPEWVAVFTAMTLMYGVAFFAVASEWFWGRWFATGLGYWGMTMTVMAWVTTRSLPPAMIIFGSMHGLVSLCLGGEKMVALFDAKPAWRERWKLDDQGVIRVRKSVTRAASSLPAVIMFALAPREGQEALALTAFALALVGLGGLLARRTAGVLAFVGASAATVAMLLTHSQPDTVAMYQYTPFGSAGGAMLTPILGVVAAVMLLSAALPFVKPMAGYVRRR
ncbi:MAG: hypothetical protein JWN44_5072 [Myxococcales bacterium]|nr:hypothetical protein [Myxococcales bacterium]